MFQASAAGLTPPAAPAVDMSGDKLLAEQLVLQLVKTQETGALARGAAATSNTNTDQQMDRMDGALKDQMVSGSGVQHNWKRLGILQYGSYNFIKVKVFILRCEHLCNPPAIYLSPGKVGACSSLQLLIQPWTRYSLQLGGLW